jgi:proline dehydrogenase
VLRVPILAAARSRHLGAAVARLPGSRAIVGRFVPGPGQDDALRVSRELTAAGLRVSLDHLGEDITDVAQVAAVVRAYTDLLTALAGEGLTERVEVSVKLTALGLDLDPAYALDAAHEIASAAAEADTTMTVDMEDHTRTDSTLDAVAALRRDHPHVGAVVQAYLLRTEADCRDLAGAGSRVRLCKGAYNEPISVAYQTKADVDSSYLRCLAVLMEGEGYPMVATHDPLLLEAAGRLVSATGRGPRDYEYQLLYGVRPDEQTRLAQTGATVRIYTPYGQEWYGYLMRRLAERPANVRFFLRALTSRS